MHNGCYVSAISTPYPLDVFYSLSFCYPSVSCPLFLWKSVTFRESFKHTLNYTRQNRGKLRICGNSKHTQKKSNTLLWCICLCSNTVSTEPLLRVGVIHALLMGDYIHICVDIITLFFPLWKSVPLHSFLAIYIKEVMHIPWHCFLPTLSPLHWQKTFFPAHYKGNGVINSIKLNTFIWSVHEMCLGPAVRLKIYDGIIFISTWNCCINRRYLRAGGRLAVIAQ